MFRKFITTLLSSAILICTGGSILSAYAADGRTLYVSPDGDDSADGSINSPLATLSGAKEKAKQLGDITEVVFRGGTYTFDETVNFNKTDKSGVTYKSYKDEKVVFTAGKAYSGFEECKVNGVRAFKKDIGKNADINILFNEETTLSKTRYPESGYLYSNDASDSDIADGCDVTDPYHAGFNGMYADKNDFADFKNITDVTVKLLHFWKDETLRISSYDGETGHVTFDKTSSMRIKKDDRFFLLNVFESLNKPGQWYFDKSEGVLYVVPDKNDTAENYTVWGSETETMISVDGTDSISFENIIFRANGYEYYTEREHSQAGFNSETCISYSNCENFRIKNCEFRDIAGCSVFFGTAVKNASVENCIFNNIGAQAVYVRGENVDINDSNVTKNITITNNIISEYGRVNYNSAAMLIIHANTVDISHNEIHDGYYTAISVGWVWGYSYNVCCNNTISDNLIYNIGQGWLSDMGGIYMLGNQPGTVISGNVIHNVSADPEQGGYGGWGIYLDEGSSYIPVEKNLVYACGSDAYHLHYGSYNTVRNNIFALSGDSQMRIVTAPGRCTPSDGGQKTADIYNNIILTDNKTPAMSCIRNKNTMDEHDNIYWDISNGGDIYFDMNEKPNRAMGIKRAVGKKIITKPIVKNPMFKNASEFDFELSPDSPVFETGFEKWNLSDAGTVSGTVIGLSTKGGQTAYNANSSLVPMTGAKELFHRFFNAFFTVLEFIRNIFAGLK